MEATRANFDSGCVTHAMSTGNSNPFAGSSASVSPTTTTAMRLEPHYGLAAAYPQNKRQNNPSDLQFQDSVKHPSSGGNLGVKAPSTPEGVSNCYVFKSRLQEYAQKVGISTPTYETIREGPSHEPYFRSTVIFGGTRYDSLIGFFNRKAAEQSAAEVALRELSAIGEKKESISVPLHETGLCKNVLQEYAQKMNYAIPTYVSTVDDSTGKNLFSCTVEIGGIQYIGAAAGCKKEAEIKAARTALLAIQWSEVNRGGTDGKANYTVVPCKRKVPEITLPQEGALKPTKSKKRRLRKKPCKNMNPNLSGNQVQSGNMATCANDNNKGILVTNQNVQVADNGQSSHCSESAVQVNGSTNLIAHTQEPVHVLGSSDTCQLTDSQQQGDINTALGDSIASLSGAVGYNDSTNIAPISSQLLPENRIEQGRDAPTMTGVNHAKARSGDHVIADIAPLINTRASEQL